MSLSTPISPIPPAPWRPIWLTFFVVVTMGFFTASGHLFSPDEEVMFRVAESMATRTRTDIAPLDGGGGNSFASRKGSNGLEYAQYGLANSMAAVPLYYAGHLLTYIIDDATARRWLDFKTVSYVPDGPGKGHALLKRFTVSFTGLLVAGATAALIARMVASFGIGGQVPFLTGVAYIMGTMAWPHARTFFSEPLATMMVLLAFYWAGGGPFFTTRRALLAGLAFAGALATRLDCAFVFPGWLIYLCSRLPGRDGSTGLIDFARSRDFAASFAKLTLAAVPIVIFLGWQLLHNFLRFGNAFESAYADQTEGINFTTPVTAGLYGFFMSPGKSIFLFSPAILLALAGWGRFARAFPGLAWGLGLAVAGKILVHATWQNWAGGWCWGPRHIFMIHALLFPAAAFFLMGQGLPKRMLTMAVLAAGAVVQLLGTSQNFIDFYMIYFRTPHQSPSAHVMYSGEDAMLGMYKVETQLADGRVIPIPPQLMPAPLQDSIYMPYNTQWARYGEMWEAGYTDNLWLRLVLRANDREREVQ